MGLIRDDPLHEIQMWGLNRDTNKNILIKDGGSIKIMFNYRQKLGGKESPI